MKIQIDTKTQSQLLSKIANRPIPFRVSYHGESTILVDGLGNWITGQVPRSNAEDLASALTDLVCKAKLAALNPSPLAIQVLNLL